MCKPEGKWGRGGSFQGKFGYKIRNFMELGFFFGGGGGIVGTTKCI